MTLHPILITLSAFFAFTLVWMPPAHAKAKHTYGFTIIAEFEEPFHFGLIPSVFANGPVITSDGTVVYSAGRTGLVASSMFSGDGTVTRLLVGPFSHAFTPLSFSVSGNGMMVTNALRDIIDVYDGALLADLDPGDEFLVGTGIEAFHHVSINNRGSVAFTGGITDVCSLGGLAPNAGVFRFDGETTTTIATFGTLADLFTVMAFPSINESGRVAFSVPFVPHFCPSTVGIEGGDLFVGDGRRLVKIAEASSAPSLNNRGEVGFIAVTGGVLSVLVSDRKKTRIVADTSGPFADFPPNPSPSLDFGVGVSLNDPGNVAFMAALDGGGFGIFTGPDVVKDKVIATGDLLAGSSVSGIVLSRQSLNNKGQIAFQATLADGRMVVVRAEPKPVPPQNVTVAALE